MARRRGNGSGRGDSAGLLGRATETAVLDDMIAAVQEGESRVLVIRGDAGLGKTALIDHTVRSARNLRVLRAVGVESEMELAFATLHQLCLPLLDRLPNLPEPQREALETVFGLRAGAPPDRFLVGLAVLSLVSDVSDEHPLLCVIDDAQWLDQASAQVLGFVARRLLAESIAVVFAAREPGRELRGLPELELAGLPVSEARALLQLATPSRLDQRIWDRIVVETRGNPLALLELPRGLTVAQMAGGFGLLQAGTLPSHIEQSFLKRIEALPADARLLLLVAAAEPIGDPALVWRAAERLGVMPGMVLASGTDGLLSVDSRVTFRHPLVRSAVYRALGRAHARPDATHRPCIVGGASRLAGRCVRIGVEAACDRRGGRARRVRTSSGGPAAGGSRVRSAAWRRRAVPPPACRPDIGTARRSARP